MVMKARGGAKRDTTHTATGEMGDLDDDDNDYDDDYDYLYDDDYDDDYRFLLTDPLDLPPFPHRS